MTDFIKTVTNSIRTFGPAPSTKWGAGSAYTMSWGSSKWGEGTEDLVTEIAKSLSESVTVSEAISDLSVGFSRTFENGLSFDSETTMEGLSDNAGYSYVFVKPTTDAESRNLSSFSCLPVGSLTYTSMPAGSTVWS